MSERSNLSNLSLPRSVSALPKTDTTVKILDRNLVSQNIKMFVTKIPNTNRAKLRVVTFYSKFSTDTDDMLKRIELHKEHELYNNSRRRELLSRDDSKQTLMPQHRFFNTFSLSQKEKLESFDNNYRIPLCYQEAVFVVDWPSSEVTNVVNHIISRRNPPLTGFFMKIDEPEFMGQIDFRKECPLGLPLRYNNFSEQLAIIFDSDHMLRANFNTEWKEIGKCIFCYQLKVMNISFNSVRPGPYASSREFMYEYVR